MVFFRADLIFGCFSVPLPLPNPGALLCLFTWITSLVDVRHCCTRGVGGQDFV